MAATQSKHPWRATVRTVFAFIAALALIVPLIVDATGLDPNSLPWVAVVLAVAGGVTRVLAIPQVNEFLQRWVYTSWLAANPASDNEDVESDNEADQFFL